MVVLALLAVYVVWGSTYYAMRVGLETLPPLTMAGVRFLLAGSAMYAVVRARGAPRPSRRDWALCAIVGVLFLTVGNGAVAIAEQTVSSGVAAIVVGSMPIWAALFGRVVGLPTNGREWLGLILGFAGVVFLHLGGQLKLGSGAAIVLVAPVSWAAGSIASKRLPLPKGPIATSMEMLAGGAVMLLLALARGERVSHPSARSIVAVLYLAAFGSIVAFTAYTWLLENVRAPLATSYAYVNPIVAVFIGWSFGGEQVGLTTIAAAIVSIGGVVLIAKRRPERKPAAT